MRIDRFITLNVARPWLSVFPSSRRVLPVLMYHSISDRNESHVGDYFKVCTAPTRFREQMQTLKDNGFTGVDLRTGLNWLYLKDEGAPDAEPFTSRPVPCAASRMLRPVVITFDDGFQDFLTEAVPVMHEHGFTATMYLPTAYISSGRRSFKGIPCLTWEEVREARGHGMTFGSHTVNHPKLHGMPWTEIEWELQSSRRELEDQLGGPVMDFAYPYAFPEGDGDFCERFREVVRVSGYGTCATTLIGRQRESDDPHVLRRLPVNEADDSALLLAKVAGAYDWLAPAQRVVKRIKRNAPQVKRSQKAGTGGAGGKF